MTRMLLEAIAWWGFWGAVAVIVWTCAGLPIVLALRAVLAANAVRGEAVSPRVSLIIVAHDEAEVIRAKLHNTLALDYPPDRLEVIVASDGSVDGTETEVEAIEDPRIKLLALPRVGKNAALNAAVERASGDVLVFTDADSMLSPAALRHLVTPFGDPDVGGVGGDYRYAKAGGVASGERAYWSFDRLWKRLQSLSGSMTSATGQLYALRRHLYRPVPGGVTDDFYCSTQAPAARLRLVFAPEAVARGPIATSIEREFARKVRLMTRGLTACWKMRRLMRPWAHGFYALQIVTHKVLRRLLGVPLTVLLASNIVLAGSATSYAATLATQACVYALAALGFALKGSQVGRSPLLALPLYFVMVNVAGLVAASNAIRGRRVDIWEAGR